LGINLDLDEPPRQCPARVRRWRKIRKLLFTLSLVAALQIDKMERSRSADLQIIQNFLDCLRSPSGLHADQDALNLSSNPLCADLFSSVIGRIDKHPVEHVADLEKKVIAILTKLSAVASGLDSEAILVTLIPARGVKIEALAHGRRGSLSLGLASGSRHLPG
jgi:hypothetical protein